MNDLAHSHSRSRALAGLIGGVALVAFLLYVRTAWYGFVNYDDYDYVVNNRHIHNGLSAESIRWALTTGYFSYWHPLTWLTYLAMISVFGVTPGPMHLLNALIHAANGALLLYVLWRMTGCTWRSAIAAALFAWHPLRVESVAWISELKDVLGTLFWLITTLAYVHYTERPSLGRYAAVAGCYLLGLASKPMLVTLPAALLLLDYWPLRRTHWLRPDEGQRPPATVGRLIVEKIPLLIMAGAVAVLAVKVQGVNYALAGDTLSLGLRLQNALVSVARYMGKFIWPQNLAVFYPHPGLIANGRIGVGVTAVAAIIVVGISVIAVWQGRRRPYLLVGWLFFLGTLLPVSGVVQAGMQAMADRYSYIPTIGLTVAIVWLVADVTSRLRTPRRIVAAVAAMALLACVIATSLQIRYWRSSEALFAHALEVTRDNYLAHASLGYELYQGGDIQGAMRHYRAALRIRPGDSLALGSMAKALQSLGRFSDAEAAYRQLIRYARPDADLHNNLANILAGQGKIDQAIEQHEAAIRIDPEMPQAYYNYAATLAAAGRLQDARQNLEQALRLKSEYPDARFLYTLALADAGELDQAKQQFNRVMRQRPDWIDAMARFAWLLATSPKEKTRDPQTAVALAEHANQLTLYEQPVLLDTLAAAQASAGRFEQAAATAQRARELAGLRGQQGLVRQIDKRLEFYRSGKPFIASTQPATAPSSRPSIPATNPDNPDRSTSRSQ